ncbi:MAG: hypothetical protein PVJ57_03845 [Phycisphaerae bacterium]|jgi:hypothetical protein
MLKRLHFAAVALALLALSGCAHNAITGDGSRHDLLLHNTARLDGEDIDLTILAGSDVRKLSIVGEGNRVVIQDGAVVHKVEVVGEDNEVTCPAGMRVEYTEIGEDNDLRYRP